MHFFRVMSAAVAVALAACGQAAAPSDAEAQPATQSATVGLSASDKTAILRQMSLSADARGQVENECGEKVTPQFLSAALGGPVGTATLFVMEGGPNTATCYGDGPDLHLMKREGAAFREIYSARGRMIIVLPTLTGGVHDIADGGPGFSFPVWKWNGTDYADSGRHISDQESARGAVYLP